MEPSPGIVLVVTMAPPLLANLVNIMNPELILLGGMFAQGQDLILPVAEAKMRSMAFAELGENVNIAAGAPTCASF